VFYNDEEVGEVTSGTWSPTLSEPIALAYVPAEHSKIGTELGVKIRGKIETATIVKKPFIKK
jgi:aminomethyltransferase